MTQNNVGILFFARKPEEEALFKHWSKKKKHNILLAKALYHHTLSVIEESKLPFAICHSEDQKGENFGERISEAISRLLVQHRQIIVIGGDCPDLSVNDIQKASAELEKGGAAMGKTFDGGSYIFTISQESFDVNSFESLPWCTSLLANALEQWYKVRSHIVVINKKVDLDAETTLYDVLKIKLLTLKKIILSIFSLKEQALLITSYPSLQPALDRETRGPPMK